MTHTERHPYIEATITHSREMLARTVEVFPDTVELGQGVAENLNNFYIPNVRDGSIVVPKEYRDTEKIPLIALKAGETLLSATVSPTPQQEDVARTFLQGLSISDNDFGQITEHLNRVLDNQPDILMFMPESCSAVTVRPFLHWSLGKEASDGPSIRLKTRPTVILQYNESDTRHEGPDSLIHETVHVIQDMKKAFGLMPPDLKIELLEEELEVHSLGARVLSANVCDESVLNSILFGSSGLSLLVDEARVRYGDPKFPFKATPRLVRQLVESDLIDSIL